MDNATEDTPVVEAPALVVPPTRAEQTRAARGAKLWTWVARATGLALLASVLGFGVYLASANAGARSERLELITQLDEERAKVDALYEQLRSIGEDPVVEPGKDSAATPGPSGPTGPQGVPGADGRAPTAAEVLAAVTAYCASVGGCKGADGAPGADGATGATGANGESVVGPQGPAGANGESVIGPQGPAGADGKDGAPGADGTNGTNGADGVSVTGVTCVVLDDLSTAFRFTFSSGATSDVRGACLP